MRRRWWPWFLLPVTIAAAVGALFSGPDHMSLNETLHALVNTEHRWHGLVFSVRAPRIALSLLVGAALGAAGTLTQGIFRNALADPSVIGVSMGAALAATISLTLGLDAIGLWTTPLAGALGGMGTLVLLFTLMNLRSDGGLALLLGGVALSAFFASLITVVLSFHLESWAAGIKVLSFLMGSFEGRVWTHVLWALPPCALGLALAVYLRSDLDLLLLGQESAHSLGVDVGLSQRNAVLAVGLLVGTTTSLVGVIGFLSLFVPHAARLVVGPQHRILLPTSVLLGALTMVGVDTLARGPLPVPPGALCSALGAPFLFFLLRRAQASMAGSS